MSYRWLALGAVILGCSGQAQTSTSTRTAATPVPEARMAKRAPPEYVPSDASLKSSEGLRAAAPGSDGGVLVGGLRVSDHGERARDVAEPPLVGGVRLPTRFGSGFLFYNASDLYFSQTMTGALEPVLSLPANSQINRLSLGPSYVLLHLATGAKIAWSPKDRQPIAMPAPGLWDVAALDDGRAVMWVEPNRFLVRGTTRPEFVPLSKDLVDIRELSVASDQVWLNGSDGHRFTLEPNGTVMEADRAPSAAEPNLPVPDARWHRRESPRELVMQAGLLLSDTLALVEVDGAFAKVDLLTGAIVGLTPAVVAGARECVLVPSSGSILCVCKTGTNGSVVIAHAESEQPHIERSFVDVNKFYAGDSGTLLRAGGCDKAAAEDRLAVCLRLPSGRWTELSMSRESSTGDSASDETGPDIGNAQVQRWIPTSDGGVLGVLTGSVMGLVDLRKRVVVPISSESFKANVGQFAVHAPMVDSSFRVASNGTIEGYSSNGSVRLTSDGTVERSPHTFSKLFANGALAIATDGRNGLWQSVDYGQTWLNVAGPPGQNGPLQIRSCSRAGCDLTSWYRIGSPATPNDHGRPNHARRAKFALLDPAPELKCTSQGQRTRRRSFPPKDRDGNDLGVAHFGARSVPNFGGEAPTLVSFSSGSTDAALLRGNLVVDPRLLAEDPNAQLAAIVGSANLRYQEPFAVPKIRETSLAWQPIFSVVTRTLGPEATVDLSGDGIAVPVLSRVAAKSDGVLLFKAPVYLWLRANSPVQVGALPPELGSAGITSAAVDVDGKLLFVAADDQSRLVKSDSTGAHTLAELPQVTIAGPPNPDVLALAVTGAPAIIRMWSQYPPTADNPALILASGEPKPLAPWATLTAGNCVAADGYRAIIVAGAGWLRLSLGGAVQPADSSFLAMVHWNQQRVCLEALEFPTAEVDLGDSTVTSSMMVRFGNSGEAHRYAFAQGSELVEDYECQLVSNDVPR